MVTSLLYGVSLAQNCSMFASVFDTVACVIY